MTGEAPTTQLLVECDRWLVSRGARVWWADVAALTVAGFLSAFSGLVVGEVREAGLHPTGSG